MIYKIAQGHVSLLTMPILICSGKLDGKYSLVYRDLCISWSNIIFVETDALS